MNLQVRHSIPRLVSYTHTLIRCQSLQHISLKMPHRHLHSTKHTNFHAYWSSQSQSHRRLCLLVLCAIQTPTLMRWHQCWSQSEELKMREGTSHELWVWDWDKMVGTEAALNKLYNHSNSLYINRCLHIKQLFYASVLVAPVVFILSFYRSLSDLTPRPGSFILLQTHRYFTSPLLTQKP